MQTGANEYLNNGMSNGTESYLNAGGISTFQCKRTCDLKHPIDTKKRNECYLGCEQQKADYNQARNDIKNPGGAGTPAGPTNTGIVPPEVPGSGAPQDGGGMSMGMIIGLSVAGLAVVGTALYFVFRK